MLEVQPPTGEHGRVKSAIFGDSALTGCETGCIPICRATGWGWNCRSDLDRLPCRAIRAIITLGKKARREQQHQAGIQTEVGGLEKHGITRAV